MEDNKKMLREYIELQKKNQEAGRELVILVSNGVKNERYNELEQEIILLSRDMEYIAKKFIESFILEV